MVVHKAFNNFTKTTSFDFSYVNTTYDISLKLSMCLFNLLIMSLGDMVSSVRQITVKILRKPWETKFTKKNSIDCSIDLHCFFQVM